MRTLYGVSSLGTVAVAMVLLWSRSSLITPSSTCRRQGRRSSAASLRLPSRKPCRADAEYSYIVTVMKPVVHVP